MRFIRLTADYLKTETGPGEVQDHNAVGGPNAAWDIDTTEGREELQEYIDDLLNKLEVPNREVFASFTTTITLTMSPTGEAPE